MTEVKEIKKNETESGSEDKIVKLTKEYNFEGEKISKLDFSGLENITADDMIRANKVLTSSGTVSIMPENDLHYTLIIAASATGYPIEFFKGLSPRDAIKVKNTVTSFFYGEE
ncbi:phage tail assembly protein [Dorea acetigenes]|uniref:Phage tail assembly protein n=1 Tax=Dorea acetigenes TaxID=2981787 RepID=A0ABT2RJX6_9FIRM|nr:phage tail assembly protein [Dorea acetigenes]MCU6685665.1 phage tail assembly protein [Dorea acetigenes]SCI58872.1 Uncharacterised protein [uncultured Clostridium sp.]